LSRYCKRKVVVLPRPMIVNRIRQIVVMITNCLYSVFMFKDR